MLRCCEQAVHKFSTSLVQVLKFGTLSTARPINSFMHSCLYGLSNTGNTQKSSQFTQATTRLSDLLITNLYPFSTGPNTNTILI